MAAGRSMSLIVVAATVAVAVLLGASPAAAHTTHICLGQDPNNGRVAFFVAHWHGAMPAVGFLRVRLPRPDGSWASVGSAEDVYTDYPFTRSVQNGVVLEDDDGGGIYNPGGLDYTDLEAQGYTCLPFNGGDSEDDMFWDYAEFGCCEGEQLRLYAEFPESFAILAMNEPGGTFTCPSGGIGAGIPPTVLRECNMVQTYTAGLPPHKDLLPNSTGVGGGCPTDCGEDYIRSYWDEFGNKTTIKRHWTVTNPCDNSTLTGVQPIYGIGCTPDICSAVDFIDLNITATYYSLRLDVALQERGKLWCGVFNITEEPPANMTVLRAELAERGFAVDVPAPNTIFNFTLQPLRRTVDYEVRCLAEDSFGNTLCYNESRIVTLDLPRGGIPPPIFNLTGGVNLMWDLVDGDFVEPGATAVDAVTDFPVPVIFEPYPPMKHIVGRSEFISYSAWDISENVKGTITRNVTFWASSDCYAAYGATYIDGKCDRVTCPAIWDVVDPATVAYNCSHQHNEVNKTKFGDTCKLWCAESHLRSPHANIAICGPEGEWMFGVARDEQAFDDVVEFTKDFTLAPGYYRVFDQIRGRYGETGVLQGSVDGMLQCYAPCYIDGVAYNHTDPHPTNACLRCNSHVSYARWTIQPRLCRHANCEPVEPCPVTMSCPQDPSGVNPAGDATPRSFMRPDDSVAGASEFAFSQGPSVCGSDYLDYPWPEEGEAEKLALRQAAGNAMPAY